MITSNKWSNKYGLSKELSLKKVESVLHVSKSFDNHHKLLLQQYFFKFSKAVFNESVSIILVCVPIGKKLEY